MTHKFDETITNLRWLEQQDLPVEIWETHYLPIVDKLNILIGTLRSYILLKEEGYDIDKLIKEHFK
jgi:hypothetical protein